MAIRLNHISKAFDGKPVLRDFSLSLPARGVVGVMGRSGGGKTTLLNLIMGLMLPDSGQITGTEGLRFTCVFQEDRLLQGWSVRRNIRLVCPRGVSDEEILTHLRAVGLEGEMNARASSLSGGMKRRAALVRAVLPKSDVLVLDEPFKGLDEAAKEAAIRYILDHAAGRFILLSTHERQDLSALGAGMTVEMPELN